MYPMNIQFDIDETLSQEGTQNHCTFIVSRLQNETTLKAKEVGISLLASMRHSLGGADLRTQALHRYLVSLLVVVSPGERVPDWMARVLDSDPALPAPRFVSR